MNQLSNTRLSGTCKWVLNACVCARTVVDVSGDKGRGERGERGERDGTGRDDSSPLTMDTLCYRRVLCIMREISQYTTRYVHKIRTGKGRRKGGSPLCNLSRLRRKSARRPHLNAKKTKASRTTRVTVRWGEREREGGEERKRERDKRQNAAKRFLAHVFQLSERHVKSITRNHQSSSSFVAFFFSMSISSFTVLVSAVMSSWILMIKREQCE